MRRRAVWGEAVMVRRAGPHVFMLCGCGSGFEWCLVGTMQWEARGAFCLRMWQGAKDLFGVGKEV